MSRSDKFKIMEVGAQWPDCDYVELALLDLTPENIRTALSADLAEGNEEGLGHWQAIGFEMVGGAMVELILHDASPVAGFVARCDALHASEETLEGLLSVLQIDRGLVKWINPQFGTSPVPRAPRRRGT